MNDGPVDIHGWKPVDFEGDYQGRHPADQGLCGILQFGRGAADRRSGPARSRAHGPRLGIVSPLAAVASLALGTSGVTPLELTGAYAPFANGGDGVSPFGIMRITHTSGKVLYSIASPRTRRGDVRQ